MSLIRLDKVSLAFGEHPLLDKIDLSIETQERIFLIGRNGMGKSTLLKVLAQHLNIDEGQIYRHPALKLGELAQSLPLEQNISVYDVVAEGLEDVGKLLRDYHHLIAHPLDNETQWLSELERLQTEIEARGGWHFQQQIDSILNQMGLSPDKLLSELSGGWQRRVSLARALVCEPNVLLLDEPTNHLDIDAIIWLEEFLSSYAGTLICITHDRTLLKKLAKRIIELDRGQLTSWAGDFDTYLEKRAHQLEVEQRQAKLFDKKLAQEEVWLRQGVKARRTRNEGRVRALEQLRRERQERRSLQGRPKFAANEANASGNLVVKAENLSFSYEGKPIVQNFDFKLFKGDKVALIGPNGVGKSTFLKLILGQIAPHTGTVKCGTQLDVAYFDQHREALDGEANALTNVADGQEMVTINGRERHVIGYLSDFLFTPERARTPVKHLSGGECNRLLLARLFSKATNLLVLDEPTNDLDIESLELLEELLTQYKGTVLLVSHDRTFVDNLATNTLLFRGQGEIIEHVGGYSDIPRHLREKPKAGLQAKPSPQVQKSTLKNSNSKTAKELEQCLEEIAKIEEKIAELESEMLSEDFYQREAKFISTQVEALDLHKSQVRELYQQWDRLESK